MTRNQIIETIAPIHQKYSKQFGIKICSTAIAQVLRESSGKYDGFSLLAYKYHNYHGLKCGDDWLKAGKPSVNMKTGEEYVVGKITEKNDWFRVFPDMDSGIKGYYEFITQYSRYKKAREASTPEEYINELVAAKYCTSSTYIRNSKKTGILDFIDKYNLRQYDGESASQIPQPVPQVAPYVPGKVYTLQSDLYVREKPEGIKLKFDALTEDGKKNGFFDNEGCAILRKGTRITCKAVSGNWMLIPSGWVCIKNSKGTYII